jgi:biopolymer transport protein ExbD
MKLKRRFTKRGRVEIIPLIDTILILLIFYMSFSSFTKKEKRIDAKMPSIATAPAVDPSKVPLDLVLHVHDKDNIMVGAATYTAISLADAMLSFASIGQQEVTVVIEADPETKYQDVISALDACAQAKLKKVAFRPITPEKVATATP